MARIVGRSRPRESFMRIQLSEVIVIVAVIAGIFYAARWYFVIYKNSPGYVLGQYLGAIKAGNVVEQYALIDRSDKEKYYPTRQIYERDAPQARGYTARIADVKMGKEQIDPKNPNIATIDVGLTVRGTAAGQQLYQTSSENVEDQYVLRKDSEGKWKVWLERSRRALLKVPPTPPGDPINS
ncbi:MAG: hypothetical protein RMJ43_05800 [Chloroherpetonaceae bacterium]|nr:hypothetical protein [Chthonomonadaceae bacterium]MDW8207330.1 hypothetical protein [Chloroherpetonaceae bacterium]